MDSPMEYGSQNTRKFCYLDILLESPWKIQAWHFTEATKAIAHMPSVHCLGALEMLQ